MNSALPDSRGWHDLSFRGQGQRLHCESNRFRLSAGVAAMALCIVGGCRRMGRSTLGDQLRLFGNRGSGGRELHPHDTSWKQISGRPLEPRRQGVSPRSAPGRSCGSSDPGNRVDSWSMAIGIDRRSCHRRVCRLCDCFLTKFIPFFLGAEGVWTVETALGAIPDRLLPAKHRRAPTSPTGGQQ